MAADNGAQKRLREESLIDSPEEKKLRYEYDELLLDDILENLDVDSVIKSLEEEISSPVETGSGLVSQPEFGYLLEASDDELGLPPSTAAELVEGTNDSFGLLENWGFPEETEFEFGAAEFGFVDGGAEYLALDGLFDFGSTEFSWRSESMSAK